jgi:hypothetical protein
MIHLQDTDEFDYTPAEKFVNDRLRVRAACRASRPPCWSRPRCMRVLEGGEGGGGRLLAFLFPFSAHPRTLVLPRPARWPRTGKTTTAPPPASSNFCWTARRRLRARARTPWLRRRWSLGGGTFSPCGRPWCCRAGVRWGVVGVIRAVRAVTRAMRAVRASGTAGVGNRREVCGELLNDTLHVRA